MIKILNIVTPGLTNGPKWFAIYIVSYGLTTVLDYAFSLCKNNKVFVANLNVSILICNN